MKNYTTDAVRQWRYCLSSTSCATSTTNVIPIRDACGTVNAEPHGVFVRRGKLWSVRYLDEPEFVIHDRVGTKYLAILLERPNHAFSSFELQCMRDGGSVGAPPPQDQEHFDRDAFRDYKRELEELRQNLDRAMRLKDQADVNRLRTEIMSIEAELRRGTSLSGRLRMHGRNEQARKNVQRAISRALDEIAICSPALRSHLRCINTGADVVYKPEDTVVWEVSY